MYVDKGDIVANLRARGLGSRADWAARTLPQLVDTSKNAAILQLLGIDATSMPSVGMAPGDDEGAHQSGDMDDPTASP